MKLLGKKSVVKKTIISDTLPKACLECDGDLTSFVKQEYLALMGKEILPLKKKSHAYVCDNCDSSFTPSVKYSALLSEKERAEQINSTDDVYARLMVASLVYTALVDGKFSLKEEELLEKVVNEAKDFPSTQAVLSKVFELQADARDYVFSVFEFARQHLSDKKMRSVLVANARMVIVDGQIKKPEHKLLKNYTKAAGLTVNMDDILAEAHEDQYHAHSAKLSS